MKLTLQSGRVTTAKKRVERHGLSHTAEYHAWAAMKDRCSNPKHSKYPAYGARLKPCLHTAWKSFKAFFHHMGPKPSPLHSLDRVRNDEGYKPGNVRWATKQQQDNNRRSTHIIEYGGIRASVTEWAQALGLRRTTVRMRLRRGWTMERVIADVKARLDWERIVETFPLQPCTDCFSKPRAFLGILDESLAA